MATKNLFEKDAPDTAEEPNADRITAATITNEQLLTLVWFTAGSPCGTVQNWLDHSADVVEVW